MPLYENDRNAGNRIKVRKEWSDAITFGSEETLNEMTKVFRDFMAQNKRPLRVAFDGWYAIDWQNILQLLQSLLDREGMSSSMVHVNTIFKSLTEIEKYKRPFFSDDPSFGIANQKGVIQDIIDGSKLEDLKEKLTELENSDANERQVFIVYGPGSTIPDLGRVFDLRFYFDTTKQSVLWKMWGGELIPFGEYETKNDYWWKEYYYCDFYLLNNQKHVGFSAMDYYIQAIEVDELNLVPRTAFDGILSTLVTYPTKNVKYAQPGPWGAYRFKQTRWDIPELSNNAWNALISPNELAMLIDVGREKMLKMPAENLMQYPEKFVGPYIHRTFPRLIPFYIWLDDGYFPTRQPAERTNMPIHNHPSTEYVNRRFKEPLGRYETYYIAEAFEGANTWMGFRLRRRKHMDGIPR